MSKVEKLAAAAATLSDNQIDTLISIAEAMKEQPFYYQAPPEALGALDLGLNEIAAGKTLPGEQVLERAWDDEIRSRLSALERGEVELSDAAAVLEEAKAALRK